DHLGNVLSTVVDRKSGYGNNAGNYVGYWANVASLNDYYPFGQVMDGRGSEHRFYRRGYNGMERDDEIYGMKNSLDFGARFYSNRLGKWLSLDPLATK